MLKAPAIIIKKYNFLIFLKKQEIKKIQSNWIFS